MRFVSSFASGHKLPSQLVKDLVSAPAFLLQAVCGMFLKGVKHSSKLEGEDRKADGQQLYCWAGTAQLIFITMALKDSRAHVGGKQHSQWAASY